MSRTLFLFLFSGRPDTYINAMAHTFDKMNVEAVKLVYVKGVTTGLGDTEAVAIANQIWNRLQELVGKAEIYHRMNERILDRHTIPVSYSELQRELQKQIRLVGGSAKCILDLTGATKVPSIDIFAVCLALGIPSVYVFELADRVDPSAPEKSLYHMLDSSSYSYTCLGDTEPVRTSRSALLRKRPLLWFTAAIALVVLAFSTLLLLTSGPQSVTLQLINLSAAVVGLVSPIVALLQERLLQ